jgi:hypothetical protein
MKKLIVISAMAVAAFVSVSLWWVNRNTAEVTKAPDGNVRGGIVGGPSSLSK